MNDREDDGIRHPYLFTTGDEDDILDYKEIKSGEKSFTNWIRTTNYTYSYVITESNWGVAKREHPFGKISQQRFFSILTLDMIFFNMFYNNNSHVDFSLEQKKTNMIGSEQI